MSVSSSAGVDYAASIFAFSWSFRVTFEGIEDSGRERETGSHDLTPRPSSLGPEAFGEDTTTDIVYFDDERI